jgi:hypothetical protein
MKALFLIVLLAFAVADDPIDPEIWKDAEIFGESIDHFAVGFRDGLYPKSGIVIRTCKAETIPLIALVMDKMNSLNITEMQEAAAAMMTIPGLVYEDCDIELLVEKLIADCEISQQCKTTRIGLMIALHYKEVWKLLGEIMNLPYGETEEEICSNMYQRGWDCGRVLNIMMM